MARSGDLRDLLAHLCFQQFVSMMWLYFSARFIGPGDGELVGDLTGTFRLGILGLIGLRFKRPMFWVPVIPPQGETTAKFTFWIFVTRSLVGISGSRGDANTGPYVTNCDFELKQVLFVYGLTTGNVALLLSYLLRPNLESSAEAFGCPNVRKSGGCESVGPFGFQFEVVDCVDSEHVVTSRASPVFPRGWRRARWLERREVAICFKV